MKVVDFCREIILLDSEAVKEFTLFGKHILVKKIVDEDAEFITTYKYLWKFIEDEPWNTCSAPFRVFDEVEKNSK